MGRSDPIILSKAVIFRNVSHVIVIEPEISAQEEVSVEALEPQATQDLLRLVLQFNRRFSIVNCGYCPDRHLVFHICNLPWPLSPRMAVI